MTAARLTDEHLEQYDRIIAKCENGAVGWSTLAAMAKRLLSEVRTLRSSRAAAFVKDCASNWDCDTGASGTHHHACRTCAAEKLTAGGAPAATGESAGRCGHVGPEDRATGNRTICTLSPGHDGNHDDGVVTWRATGESAGGGPDFPRLFSEAEANVRLLSEEIERLRCAPPPPAGADPRAQGFREGVEAAQRVCEGRAASLARDGNVTALCEASKCALAVGALAPSSDTGSPDADPERK